MILLYRKKISVAMIITAVTLISPVACLTLQSPLTRRTMSCCDHRTPVLSHTKLQLSNYIEDIIDEDVVMTKSPLTDDDIESNNNKIILDNSSDSIEEESINKQAGLFDNINSERTLGILVLLTVPLAWGTYSPVVKYMYDKMNPSMPGFVFSGKSLVFFYHVYYCV